MQEGEQNWQKRLAQFTQFQPSGWIRFNIQEEHARVVLRALIGVAGAKVTASPRGYLGRPMPSAYVFDDRLRLIVDLTISICRPFNH
jgi:hypothetical protein